MSDETGSPSWLERTLAVERPSWICWAPVGMGCGIVFYFSLPTEPSIWLPPLLLAALLLGQSRLKPEAILPLFTVRALTWALFGLVVAQSWANGVSAPVLTREIGPTGIEGRIRSVDPLESGTRLVLDHLIIERLGTREMPERVRVRLYQSAIPQNPPLAPGQRVRLLGKLAPPGEPVLPGGFDGARRLWFQKIGATGYALGPITIIPETAQKPGVGLDRAGEWLSLKIQAVRTILTRRLMAAGEADGNKEAGALAAALLTGDRSAIPQVLQDAYRAGGIAHLLSISGLHMSMIGGLFFFMTRAVLALVPPMAERYPIKKIAAVVAMLASGFYLAISGADVPAQRAFVMFGLLLLAVLVDRKALSRRTIAIAALIVLLIAPESLLGASFQMSFAAVVAMIAAYEAYGTELTRIRAGKGWRGTRAAGVYVIALVATTLIATTATTPFGLYHFGKFYIYGLIGNGVAVPVTGFWVMPWGVAALMAMPFGLERVPVMAMGWGLDAINWISLKILAWPDAVINVPKGPGWALALTSFGGLWLCLWQSRWRWAGLPLFVFGLTVPFFGTPPDVLVSSSGKLIAVRSDSPRGSVWFFNDLRRDRFARRVWTDTYEIEAERFPKSGTSGPLTCDGDGCTFRRHGKLIALPQSLDAFMEDAGRADVIIAPQWRAPSRTTAELTIDDAFLLDHGATSLWIERDGQIRLQTNLSERGQRPWTSD